MTPSPHSVATPSPILDVLEQLHARFAGLDAGAVAQYIPELAKADPTHFGITIAMADGQVYEVGQSRQRFTIQSVSKPLVYGAALEDQGLARVLQSVGVEPSGEAFNSISLEPGSGRPLNPMINAGAIAVASLIKGDTQAARLQRVVDVLSAYAGRALDIDEAVFRSERDTGHRNRAIAHLLRNYGIFDSDPEPALELYFKQCSLQVDCRDLAMIAATLANGGVNPISGQRAVRAEHISSILSVMTTCGIYDFTGEWVFRVGLPAKSGVGGGIMAVLPGQLGIGVYSPLLDERGNSVRGVQVCQTLSVELGLHSLQPQRAASSTVRSRYTLANVRSRRQRPPEQAQLLDQHGCAALVYELQGDLHFSTVEPLLREIVAADESLEYLTLDFKRVGHADAPATRLLARLIEGCAARGVQVHLTRVRRGELLAGLGAEIDPRWSRAYSFHAQLDLGLEACERGLLVRHGADALPATRLALADHSLCAGASVQDLAFLADLLQHCQHQAGDMLVQRGRASDQLYLLMRGEVSVVVPLPGGGHKRLDTLTAGMTFGESSLQRGAVRTADVRADTEVECLVLDAASLARLEAERPELLVCLLHNLLARSTQMITRLTAEVAALDSSEHP